MPSVGSYSVNSVLGSSAAVGKDDWYSCWESLSFEEPRWRRWMSWVSSSSGTSCSLSGSRWSCELSGPKVGHLVFICPCWGRALRLKCDWSVIVRSSAAREWKMDLECA